MDSSWPIICGAKLRVMCVCTILTTRCCFKLKKKNFHKGEGIMTQTHTHQPGGTNRTISQPAKLQYLQNSKWLNGSPKMTDIFWKGVSIPCLLGTSIKFDFFESSTLWMIKVDYWGDIGRGDKIMMKIVATMLMQVSHLPGTYCDINERFWKESQDNHVSLCSLQF